MEHNQPKYSQLKAMLAIAKASFISSTRSPSTIVFSIVFPLIFILVFGFMGGNKVKVEAGLIKGSDTTHILYQQLKASGLIKFKWVENYASIEADLKKGGLDGALLIKPGQESDNRPVELYLSASSPDRSKILASIVNGVIQNATLAKANELSKIADLHTTEVVGRPFKTIDFILPGQLGFSILSTGVFGTAFVFISLRQTMVLKRFYTTPIRKIYIVIGEAFSRLVFSLLGTAVILVMGRFLFGFTLIHGVTTFLQMLVLAALGLMVFMGFGFVVSGIAKTESNVPPIANIITLPQFLLAGTFFPISAFPSWLQPISHALPLTYLNDAMRKVAFEGQGLSDVWLEILVLSAWGVVAYAASSKLFKWDV